MFHAWFAGAVALSFFCCFLIKKHLNPAIGPSRLGGIGVALSFFLIVTAAYIFGNPFGILAKDYWSILAAQMFLILGGAIDDRFTLKPFCQLIFQSAAAVILLAAKDTINHANVPFIGLVYFVDWFNYLLSFIWIILVINAFNWFDGLDGLAGGVGIIGMIVLFFLSLTPLVAQPQTAFLALVVAGSLVGFIYFNFSPAYLHLGSVGSGFVGLMLATLSIYAGGKVATALLILGIPIMDFCYVVVRRILRGAYPWQGGDREHFHYWLLDRGWSVAHIVILFYAVSGFFGVLALTLQTGIKIAAILALVAIFLLFSLVFRGKTAKKTIDLPGS